MIKYVIMAGVVVAVAMFWANLERDRRLKAEGELAVLHRERLSLDSAAHEAERIRIDSMRAFHQREAGLIARGDSARADARRAQAGRNRAVAEAESLRASVDSAVAALLASAGDSTAVAGRLDTLVSLHMAQVNRLELAIVESDRRAERLQDALEAADSVVSVLRGQLAVTEAARAAEEDRAAGMQREIDALNAARPGLMERVFWKVIAPAAAFVIGHELGD